MSEPHQAVAALVTEARRLRNATAQYAYQMADLLVGNLRSVNNRSVLTALKRELSKYNIHTGKWKP